MEAYSFYRPRRVPEPGRYPLSLILLTMVLLALLVGAAYRAGEVSGYNLGYFDAEHNITVQEQ